MIREFKDSKPQRTRPIRDPAPKKPARQTTPANKRRSNSASRANRNNFSGTDVSWKRVGLIAAIAALVIVLVVAVVFLIPSAEDYGNQIQRITLAGTPDKTQFYTGERANYKGLTVLVTLKNGDSYTVDYNDCVITGFDSSAPAESQTITVSYEGFTATYNIVILENVKPSPVLDSIYLETLPKTEYKLGEWLSTDGGVIVRKYKDGSTARINLVNSYVYGFVDITEPGEYELSVKYVEDGVLAETTYTITVTE